MANLAFTPIFHNGQQLREYKPPPRLLRLSIISFTSGYTGPTLPIPRGPSFGLIEVKPHKRGNDVSIQVQESAQMAAWIPHHAIASYDPNKSCEYVLRSLLSLCSRLTRCKISLLSQDKNEIYVTFPHLSGAYGKNSNIKDLKLSNLLRTLLTSAAETIALILSTLSTSLSALAVIYYFLARMFEQTLCVEHQGIGLSGVFRRNPFTTLESSTARGCSAGRPYTESLLSPSTAQPDF